MRLSGYQPQYFPRLHYFARVLDSDIFEISDYVQFVKKHAYPAHDGKQKRGKSYQAHTIIKEHNGTQLLNVPTKNEGLKPINETALDYVSQWNEKHLKTIKHAYSKAQMIKSLAGDIENIFKKTYPNIAELNITTIFWAFARLLGDNNARPSELTIENINKLLSGAHPFRLKQVVMLSQTDITPPNQDRDANDWIIDICKRYNADEYYYGGTSASAYMDFERFRKEGINLIEQNWKCAPYSQQYKNAGFIPNLSIIDLLANEPIERAREILQTK